MIANIKCVGCPAYKNGWKLTTLYEICKNNGDLKAETCTIMQDLYKSYCRKILDYYIKRNKKCKSCGKMYIPDKGYFMIFPTIGDHCWYSYSAHSQDCMTEYFEVRYSTRKNGVLWFYYIHKQKGEATEYKHITRVPKGILKELEIPLTWR